MPNCTRACLWSSGDATAVSSLSKSSLATSRPLGTVSLRRAGVVAYMRVLSWTHNRIVVEVPEGVGVNYELHVQVCMH